MLGLILVMNCILVLERARHGLMRVSVCMGCVCMGCVCGVVLYRGISRISQPAVSLPALPPRLDCSSMASGVTAAASQEPGYERAAVDQGAWCAWLMASWADATMIV